MRRAAAKADLDQAVLSRIENGHRLPSEDQLTALAGIYNQNLNNLLMIKAFTEIKRKYGDAGYYPDCLQLLHEDAAVYNRKNP